VQLHSQEPRTTLDIDLAVRTFADIPRDALTKAGFIHEGRHQHSDNWRAPGSGPRAQRTAIQFSSEDVGIDVAHRSRLSATPIRPESEPFNAARKAWTASTLR